MASDQSQSNPLPTHTLPAQMRRFSIGNNGDATVEFIVCGMNGYEMTSFEVTVGVQPEGTVDAMIAAAHRVAMKHLIGWYNELRVLEGGYAKRGA